MSAAPPSAPAGGWMRPPPAPVFAALGDETRLSLVAKLCGGPALSIARLAVGSGVTRQAIRKHLGVLERQGLVRSARRGRETLFRLEPEPLDRARKYLDVVSAEWGRALERLRSFVEDRPERGSEPARRPRPAAGVTPPPAPARSAAAAPAPRRAGGRPSRPRPAAPPPPGRR